MTQSDGSADNAYELDLKGKACPVPVMETKQFLENTSTCLKLEIQVDNMAAVENLSRFLENRGFTVIFSEKEGVFMLSAVKNGKDDNKNKSVNMTGDASSIKNDNAGTMNNPQIGKMNTLVMIASDRLGEGDEVLGRALLRNFILTLREMGDRLWRIIFLNSGVRLTVEGSESLESLLELEKSGVSILVCGTCLNHYGLLEKKKTGETTNMLDVVTSLEAAEKVITI